jgi:uncharacterized membrane protein YeiB
MSVQASWHSRGCGQRLLLAMLKSVAMRKHFVRNTETARPDRTIVALARAINFYLPLLAVGAHLQNEVASKYCSSAINYAAAQNSYEIYVESIAPGAYKCR